MKQLSRAAPRWVVRMAAPAPHLRPLHLNQSVGGARAAAAGARGVGCSMRPGSRSRTGPPPRVPPAWRQRGSGQSTAARCAGTGRFAWPWQEAWRHRGEGGTRRGCGLVRNSDPGTPHPAPPTQPRTKQPRTAQHSPSAAPRRSGAHLFSHFVNSPIARPQRLTGEVQPVRGASAFHPPFAYLMSCGRSRFEAQRVCTSGPQHLESSVS